MTTKTVLRLVAVVTFLAGVSLLVVSPATAEPASSIDDVGWWTRANQDATLGAVLVFPDVTPGQLLVEGTPEGATAIAAVRATLPEGTGNPVLTLDVASAVGAEAAVLLACQSGSGWTGAHAGSWAAKPSPDCSQSVQGLLSEDGTQWSFALGPLQFDEQIDVVLTPGLVEGGEAVGSAFRVVFERVATGSVEVSKSSASPSFEPPPVVTPSTGGASGTGFAAPPPSGSSTGFSSSPATPSFSVPVPRTADELAAQPAQAALPPTEQGQTATAPILSAAQPLAAPVPAPASGDGGRLLGLLVVLAAGGLLYWANQQPVPARQVLSRFATAAVGASAPASGAAEDGAVVPTVGGSDEAEDATMGGLGRFRRPRSTPAARIGG